MSIFEAMEGLAGAALLALAPASGLTPSGAERGCGAAVVAALREQGHAEVVDDLVGEMTREVWVGSQTRTLAQDDIERHFGALARIVAQVDIAPAILAAMADGSGGNDLGRRIGVDLFGKAQAAGLLAPEGVRDDVSLFLLDRVFTHLTGDRARLALTKSAVAASIETAAAPAAAAGAAAQAPEEKASDGDQAILARLRERYELSPDAQDRLLALVASLGVPHHQRLERLEAMAAWVQEARAQLLRPTNEDVDLRKLKMRAAAALADGELAVAMEQLKLVRRELRDGRRRIEARLEDEVAALKAQMTEEARATARLGELAAARQDFDVAVDLFAEAAENLPKSARGEAWRYHIARADALHRKAEIGNDDRALGEARAAYAGVVKLLADGSNPGGSALAHIGLGKALARQGASEAASDSRLADAAEALRKGLALITAEEETRQWRQAQAELGAVMARLGQGGEQVAATKDAVAAYRAARGVLDDEVPAAERVSILTGLGIALLELAEQERAPALLEEAVDAFTQARAAAPRGERPMAWALASMNLGSALLGAAEGDTGGDRLRGAIAALRGALEVLTPDHAPEHWPQASTTLADALAALAQREGDAEGLVAAAAAYRTALGALDRGSRPLPWAIAQMNLGNTLIRLGELRDKGQNWLAAATCLMPALEVFEAEGAKSYADMTRRSLRLFHEQLEGLIAGPAAAAAAAPGARLTKVG